ncbi:MAG: nucleotidyltransferase family protein [Proteobacteria bacterium]|nr:nucleotidyltransferase family protein [Pseudomonadota bacterium]
MIQTVMLLAAGRGSRLAPLTDSIPKPLICVGGEPLIIRHIRRFAAAGICQVVINLHHLGEQIEHAVGDGSAFGVQVHYSHEEQLLAAAGGIRLAIARGLLTAPFALANGDIICDYDVNRLHHVPQHGAHLICVSNPPAKPVGDFSLLATPRGTQLQLPTQKTYTYAGIGVYHPDLFNQLTAGEAHELLPLLKQAILNHCASGEYYPGRWHDIGTPAALAQAQAHDRS